jgi:hypothetical protein
VLSVQYWVDADAPGSLSAFSQWNFTFPTIVSSHHKGLELHK